MIFAMISAEADALASRLGIDWGLAVSSIETGAVERNSTVCAEETLVLSGEAAVISTAPGEYFGPYVMMRWPSGPVEMSCTSPLIFVLTWIRRLGEGLPH
jgi:hypothetical protein